MNSLSKPEGNNPNEKAKGKAKFSKKMFTVSEDAIIIRCVSIYGTNNWKLISQFLPGRSIRQLRERYNTYLKPGTLNAPWTPEEDLLLSQKVKEYGKHWKAISQFFKGRNQNNIKNRWNFHLKGGAALNISKIEQTVNNNQGNNINNNFNHNIISADINNDKSTNANDSSINYINGNISQTINKDINNSKNDKSDIFDINNSDNLNNKTTNGMANNNNLYSNINLTTTQNEKSQNSKEKSLSIPLFNNSQKSNQNEAHQTLSEKASDVFNEEDFELYCSNVFSGFQFDNSNNSEQSQTKNND